MITPEEGIMSAQLLKGWRRGIVLWLMWVCVATTYSCAAPNIDLSKIKLPPGFEITVYSDKVEGDVQNQL
jgi:hypothetical protein